MTAADRPTVPHPDLDTLADLDAGVLDPAAAGDVAAHVGGCEQCTAAMAAFEAVRADLRDLPVPVMPESVVARLDATLADLRRGSAGPAAAPATRPPLRPPGPGQSGQAGGDPAGGPRSGADRSPAGPADLTQARQAREARERRRRSIKLSTGAAAAAFVLVAAGASVTALVSSVGDETTSAGAPAAGADNLPGEAAAPSEGGMPSYDKDSLPGAIDSIRRNSAVDEITRLGEAGPGGAMADAARRQACERSIPRGGDRSLTAVRKIFYEGKPTYVFVFTPLDGGATTAYVVSEDCGTGALVANVLDQVR